LNNRVAISRNNAVAVKSCYCRQVLKVYYWQVCKVAGSTRTFKQICCSSFEVQQGGRWTESLLQQNVFQCEQHCSFFWFSQYSVPRRTGKFPSFLQPVSVLMYSQAIASVLPRFLCYHGVTSYLLECIDTASAVHGFTLSRSLECYW
jgi:hypothetical protein